MKALRYLLILLLQAAGCLVAMYLLFNLMWAGNLPYRIVLWVVMPLIGLVSAYLTTCKGVNNYLAWIAPPAMSILAHYLVCFYLPDSAIPFFVCGLTSVIGAAAGDVVKKSSRKGRN